MRQADPDPGLDPWLDVKEGKLFIDEGSPQLNEDQWDVDKSLEDMDDEDRIWSPTDEQAEDEGCISPTVDNEDLDDDKQDVDDEQQAGEEVASSNSSGGTGQGFMVIFNDDDVAEMLP